jgi:hypothetical protein
VEQLTVASSSDLVNGLRQSVCSPANRVFATYRRVQVDEDGSGNVFATARLGEEGLKRAALVEVLGLGVGAAIGQQAVLEKVPEEVVSALGLRNRVGSRCVQLPGAVTELGTGLADVKVADLSSFALAFGASIQPQWASAESKEVLRSNSSPVIMSQLGTRPWGSHRVQAPTVGGCCSGVGAGEHGRASRYTYLSSHFGYWVTVSNRLEEQLQGRPEPVVEEGVVALDRQTAIVSGADGAWHFVSLVRLHTVQARTSRRGDGILKP